MKNKTFKTTLALLVMGAVSVIQPAAVHACAACYGKSDSPLAAGMNWGIFALLVVIVGVLSVVASFFVFLAKKASAVSAISGGDVDGLGQVGQLQSDNSEKV